MGSTHPGNTCFGHPTSSGEPHSFVQSPASLSGGKGSPWHRYASQKKWGGCAGSLAMRGGKCAGEKKRQQKTFVIQFRNSQEDAKTHPNSKFLQEKISGGRKTQHSTAQCLLVQSARVFRQNDELPQPQVEYCGCFARLQPVDFIRAAGEWAQDIHRLVHGSVAARPTEDRRGQACRPTRQSAKKKTCVGSALQLGRT